MSTSESAENTCSLQASAVNAPGFSRVVVLGSVDSTNRYAVDQLLAQDGFARLGWGELSLISTADQTNGRGRLDRVWTAPRGSSLCTSFVARPHADAANRFSAKQYHWVTQLVALAAIDALAAQGIVASIKWPNDILVGDRKICGILSQLVTEPDGHYSIVSGIGINANMSRDQLPMETATSIECETGKQVELESLLSSLAKAFASHYGRFKAVQGEANASDSEGKSLLKRVRETMSTLGQRVMVMLPGNEKVYGTAIDINADGEIMVRDDLGTVSTYSVGDVVHLRPVKP
ncbi:MAG: biotin--[acetyl-CoA-carboxylase] ligase [Rothia sp. (in: high G+C Gram-positive bacteria)]|nr:biotin--[acetyl-CoA-carboxylase] ligase [Rothia sp. (in: high G+C Gram-positive bacteria)]